ncbi:MAG: mandelate racemase/muconate lactonizing enzyme family protein [Gammaproteobacteria bacterium]|nr:mandelate racemase/muconate lactonizing enzyme family protein [Gammaproteobacteria bacterium]
MKITEIRTTPLLVPYLKPYHWAQGVIDGATVILVEVHTDAGLTGYGESIGTPSARGIQHYIEAAGAVCIGRDPYDNAGLMSDAYHALFQALGTCSAPRFGGQVLAGVEMALWDLVGKASGLAVHQLLGGAVRDEIRYFGFPQGETAEEIAGEAKLLAESGCEVIYIKVGRGDALDLEIARQVRSAIGPEKRLRMDPNEHWSPVRAAGMIRKMTRFDVEFIEQPTNCESITALAQVRANSPVAIAADQLVFTPQDAFNVCREKAADLIVLGLHETGGLLRFSKASHVAEAAGIDVCIHGLYETGITTCAANQVAATLPNLDDGNQYMNHFLEWDIIKSPDLSLRKGRLPVLAGPGLGFELDWDAVKLAIELYQARAE